jgi:hypothetical protein
LVVIFGPCLVDGSERTGKSFIGTLSPYDRVGLLTGGRHVTRHATEARFMLDKSNKVNRNGKGVDVVDYYETWNWRLSTAIAMTTDDS